MTCTVTSYQQRVNDERFVRQHPAVQKTAREILKELESLETCLYWALDPEEDGGAQWASSLIEHTHALLDLSHEYRFTLLANPPPKEAPDAA